MADVELLERLYGYNWAELSSQRDGLAAVSDAFAPDFEYRLPPEIGMTLHGIAGIRAFVGAIEQDFSELRQECREFIDTGGHIVVLGTLTGRGRASGVPFHSPFGHVWTIRDGQAVRLEGYLDEDQARRAVEAEG